MNLMRKIWIWLCRFRKRKGYGVHSPFAYTLIRSVINERTAYYAYAELKSLRKESQRCSRQVDELLFRLSNYKQPHTVVQVGQGARISLRYLSAGCAKARCVMQLEDEDELTFMQKRLWRIADEPIDILHITFTSHYAALFEEALSSVSSHSLFIIEQIHESEDKLAWWKSIQQDERVGITFDLYEVGLVFFDKHLCKQHYIVNFN